MNGPPRYVLDTNVFIEAARRYYAFDIAPAFWSELVRQAGTGRLLSIDRVKNELARGKDDLAQWANNQFRRYFALTNDGVVLDWYGQIMTWASQQPQFIHQAKADFARADNADAWVVAYAKAKGYVVVTHEQYNPNIRRKIPIPNVCQAFKVLYVDTFEMLRKLGVKFQ